MFHGRPSKSLPVVALLCAFAGCSQSNGPECYPVHGQVSYHGKPLAEAMVVMHRVAGDVEGNQKPIAFTAEDGGFAISTMKSGDGAPPGEYVITIELRAPQTIGEEAVRNGPNMLPARYARPESSNLKFTVEPHENKIPAIVLL